MPAKSRNLFRLSRFILLKLPSIFKLAAKFRKPQKRLLIIKTDAIGDYILFRNFIESVKTSAKYKDHSIHLLGNELWSTLALKYDCEFVDEFVFINAEALYHQPFKILRLALSLFCNNYESVLQPSFTRRMVTDGLAALTAAPNLVGFTGDAEGIDTRYKVKTDRFYTWLLNLPAGCYFEFDRSKYFFEMVLDQSLPIKSPAIGFEKQAGGYVMLFPGAAVLKRAWEREKFLELAERIITQTTLKIYIAGGQSELELAYYLSSQLPVDRIINLVGKTSLTQLITLAGNASLVISNETSAVHIAAATKTKAICILGGGHFNRFAPYPQQISDPPACVYQPMECFNCNWNCLYPTPEKEPYPCISAITPGMVWAQVSAAFASL